MDSIENQIERVVKSKSRGVLWFPDDFAAYGSSEAVRKSLQRLEDKNILVRVAQGIYVRPKISSHVGQVLPTAEEVAFAIARRDRARIIPTGTYALNALGLSTQVPMRIVLLTDGSPRQVRVGRRTIVLKRTTPKNLMAKGKISGLAIQALKELGQGRISAEEELKIIKLLRTEKPEDLAHDVHLAPVWIKQIMKKAM